MFNLIFNLFRKKIHQDYIKRYALRNTCFLSRSLSDTKEYRFFSWIPMRSIGDPIRDERADRSDCTHPRSRNQKFAAFCRAGSVMRLRFAAFSRGQLFHGASHGCNGRPDRIRQSTLQFSPSAACADTCR